MEESKISRAVAETAARALKEETDRWLPQPKGLPAVGQRVRLIGTHPWAGSVGTVRSHEGIPWANSLHQAAIIDLEDAAGLVAEVFGAQDWQALE